MRTPIVNHSQCLSDTYDAVLCVGAHSRNHIGYICYDSLAAITKPGNKFVRKMSKHWSSFQKTLFFPSLITLPGSKFITEITRTIRVRENLSVP